MHKIANHQLPIRQNDLLNQPNGSRIPVLSYLYVHCISGTKDPGALVYFYWSYFFTLAIQVLAEIYVHMENIFF